jgi:hypothetical protein
MDGADPVDEDFAASVLEGSGEVNSCNSDSPSSQSEFERLD